MKALAKAGALGAFAHVLHNRMLKAEMAFLQVGMPLTDAGEQAEQEWLLMELETEGESS